MEARLVAFISIVTVLTVTPGPDMALVARVVFGKGRVAGWLTSLGVVSGHLLWGIASALGVATVLSTSAMLYTILRLIGAAYLIWLGLQALFSRDTHKETTVLPLTNKAGVYRQGLINNLLNPKIGAFYPIFLTSILLAALFALIGIIWLTIYVVILSKAGNFFRRSLVRHAMERITGV